MKNKILAVAIAVCMVGTAYAETSTNADSTSGANSGAAAYNTGNTLQNYFAASPSYEKFAYSGSYTVKTNASLSMGSFAPSMSGYNCSATAQGGGSTAQGGITAIFGIPVLLTGGKVCILFTAANMNTQIAAALAPVNPELAMKHMRATDNLLCSIGDYQEEVRKAMIDAGIGCPDEKGEIEGKHDVDPEYTITVTQKSADTKH